MKKGLAQFSREYRNALTKFLAGNLDERRVSALGRRAVAAGLEMLDLASIHEDALRQSQAGTPAARQKLTQKKAGAFFANVITPIEETHRGARDTAVRLDRLNRSLTRRTAELAASNQRLRKEIDRRAIIEKDLRQSQRHYSRLLAESARLQERLRDLSRQILSTQEEERKKISRDLHDQVASTLAAVNLQLSDLRKDAAGNSETLSTKIANTQQLIQDSVDIIHRFARELRPTTLDDLGLIPALHGFARTFLRQTGIRIALAVSPKVEELDIAKRTVLYRVAQEALNNVAKHAHASRVEVKIRKVKDTFTLCVADDGKSFRVEPFSYRQRNKRLGLLGMRERVEMVGGTFSVESQQGRGTSVLATIPVDNRRGNGSSAAPSKRVRDTL